MDHASAGSLVTGKRGLVNLLHQLLNLVGRQLSRNKLHIFIYHQVLEVHDPLRPVEPTAEQFEQQMQLVSKFFTPLTLSEGVDRLNNGTLPANAVCITFDDGYVNNLTLAQPILEKYQIPATVYVATAFSGGQNMWNDRVMHLFSQREVEEIVVPSTAQTICLGDNTQRKEAAYKLLADYKYLEPDHRLDTIAQLYEANPDVASLAPQMMTPVQVKELSDRGIEIGAHTHNHPILKVLDVDRQAQEIEQSRVLLQEWTGKPVNHFAYPNGVWNKDLDEDTVSIVEKMGFESAVITNWGTATNNTSAFKLPRFTPWDKHPLKFHARMLKNCLN